MSFTIAPKAEVIKAHQAHKTDTGTPEVQVAIMTNRIRHLTEHFKAYKKDFHSRRGLVALVNKRRKLLQYLKRKNLDRYKAIIKKLELRDSY